MEGNSGSSVDWLCLGVQDHSCNFERLSTALEGPSRWLDTFFDWAVHALINVASLLYITHEEIKVWLSILICSEHSKERSHVLDKGVTDFHRGEMSALFQTGFVRDVAQPPDPA